tara:strand:+ start:1759 stop:2163 length:405 start_codon:yes stop_codon:yes gene_type:complete
MKDQLEAVEKFHVAFGVGESPNEPTLIEFDDYILRHDLMEEENGEYKKACLDRDLVEIADALGDKLYILCGTILKHGMQHKIVEVFNEIQASNMSKLGEDGKPILRSDGKILKGKNYFKPKITEILGEESNVKA